MNRGVSRVRILLVLIIALSTSLLISYAASAKSSSLTDEEEVIWSQNNITFYEPCDTTKKDNSEEICGDNKNYAGDTVLTEENLAAVKAHQPIYKQSADKYGFPWEILAALHYREWGLKKSNPPNLQGVYQLYSYTNGGENGNAFKPAGKISDEEFQRQTDIVAELIHNNYGNGLDLKNDNDIKKMFFNFNGAVPVYIERAKKMGFSDEEANRGEGSPYVMNRYDARRDPKSSEVDNNWLGKYTSDKNYDAGAVDQQWGAFTVYKALTCEGNEEASNDSGDDDTGADDGSSGSGAAPASNASADNGANAQKIAETALKLAYSYADRSKASSSSPSDAFIDATDTLGTWNKNKSHGPDCGFFVKAVLSTAVPDAVDNPGKATIDEMRKALVSGKNTSYSKYWEVIDFKDGDISKLKSGDVIWWQKSSSSQHYFIIAEQEGSLYKVEASYSKKLWGRVSTKLKKSGSIGKKDKQYIFRPVSDGAAAPSCNSCEKGSMNVNGTAACLSWPLGTDKDKYTYYKGGSGTEQFQEAWKELGMGSNNGTFHYNGHSAKSWKIGAYCSGFAAAVVRWSGVDPHFSTSQPGQLAYVKKHTDIWDYFKWSGKKEDLQGGDVLDKENGHTWMVVEDENGEMYVAEASLHGFTFGHITDYHAYSTSDVWVFRAKNARNSNAGVSVTDGVKSSSTTGTITTSGKGNGDIGASAIELAWPDESGSYTKKPTSKFSSFFNTFSQSKSDKGNCYADGKSCDRFAATAIRYSGVDENIPFGAVPALLDHVEKSGDWEKVDMADPKSLKEYQSGDLVFFYRGNSLEHVGIYAVDSNGQGHVVQASICEYFGVVKDTSNITSSSYFTGTRVVYRNKNNKNNGGNKDECNLCPEEQSDEEGGEGGELKDGGFSSAKEAEKAIIGAYKKYNGNPVTDFGTLKCNNSRDNCSTFSLWFLKTYVGWNAKLGGDGKQIANNIYKTYHSKYPEMTKSSTPSVYSVASWSSPVGNIYSSNHTGVVVGINEAKDEILIADAAWCAYDGQIRVDKLSKFKGHGTYVSLAPYIKGLEK